MFWKNADRQPGTRIPSTSAVLDLPARNARGRSTVPALFAPLSSGEVCFRRKTNSSPSGILALFPRHLSITTMMRENPMNARHQMRNIMLLAMLLILAMKGYAEPNTADSSLPMIIPLQCKTLSSRECLLFEKQGSCEGPRGTFRRSLNECRLCLVCSARVFRQPNRRADRSRDGRVETKTPARAKTQKGRGLADALTPQQSDDDTPSIPRRAKRRR